MIFGLLLLLDFSMVKVITTQTPNILEFGQKLVPKLSVHHGILSSLSVTDSNEILNNINIT